MECHSTIEMSNGGNDTDMTFRPAVQQNRLTCAGSAGRQGTSPIGANGKMPAHKQAIQPARIPPSSVDRNVDGWCAGLEKCWIARLRAMSSIRKKLQRLRIRNKDTRITGCEYRPDGETRELKRIGCPPEYPHNWENIY